MYVHYNKTLSKHGYDIFKCNISKTDANKLNFNHTFLKNIISSWCSINYTTESMNNLPKEIIWNNSNIKHTNGNMFLYKKWLEKDIIFIDQIYDFQVKDFLTFEQMQNEYGIENGEFLNYLSQDGSPYFIYGLRLQ